MNSVHLFCLSLHGIQPWWQSNNQKIEPTWKRKERSIWMLFTQKINLNCPILFGISDLFNIVEANLIFTQLNLHLRSMFRICPIRRHSMKIQLNKCSAFEIISTCPSKAYWRHYSCIFWLFLLLFQLVSQTYDLKMHCSANISYITLLRQEQSTQMHNRQTQFIELSFVMSYL